MYYSLLDNFQNGDKLIRKGVCLLNILCFLILYSHFLNCFRSYFVSFTFVMSKYLELLVLNGINSV
jgi:hypothetical protein